VAAASSDGVPTGGRGSGQFWLFAILNDITLDQRGGALTEESDRGR